MNILTNSFSGILFLFVPFMIISIILMQSGFFKWAAATMIFSAEGNGKRLFLHVILLASVVSALYSYFGQLTIILPIAYELLKNLNAKKYKLLPYVFITTFILEAGFVINYQYLNNIIITALIEITIIIIILLPYFKNIISSDYDTTKLFNPDDYVTDWVLLNIGLLIMFIVAIAFFIGINKNINITIVPVIGAIILILYKILKNIFNWGILNGNKGN